ncbi:MAG: Do family serine endopeptidase [Candidatus Omnitrophota bacterium]|nr:Do family serine endopeptidase [Candidatus Omnitrophota bacterium]
MLSRKATCKIAEKVISLVITSLFFSLCAHSQNLNDLESSIIKVASDVGKSVVSISSVAKERVRRQFHRVPFGESEGEPLNRFFEEFFGNYPDMELKRMGLGSGVIIDKSGYILTNEHVVSEATQIKVKLSDGREFDAEVKGVDTRSDLAVIKINASDLPVARLGKSDNLKIGQWAVAIGNPFGFAIENSEPTVTVGVISALHRYVPALGRRERSYDELIQTDAAINPGNSGGPLVDLNGEVIGINTAIITTSGGYQGLGFAISVDKAKKILNKLIKGEKIVYGWLGVSVQDLNDDLRNYFGTKEDEGVIIVKVYPDSPAQKSNLREGDLILSFNNQPIKKTKDVVNLVSSSEAEKTYPVKIIREGKELILDIKITSRPEDVEKLEQAGVEVGKAIFRGMAVADISSLYKQRFRIKESVGVVVVHIEEGSAAAKSDISVGDLIIKVNGKDINNKEEFISVVSKIKGSWLLKTKRGFFVVKEK